MWKYDIGELVSVEKIVFARRGSPPCTGAGGANPRQYTVVSIRKSLDPVSGLLKVSIRPYSTRRLKDLPIRLEQSGRKTIWQCYKTENQQILISSC